MSTFRPRMVLVLVRTVYMSQNFVHVQKIDKRMIANDRCVYCLCYTNTLFTFISPVTGIAAALSASEYVLTHLTGTNCAQEEVE